MRRISPFTWASQRLGTRTDTTTRRRSGPTAATARSEGHSGWATPLLPRCRITTGVEAPGGGEALEDGHAVVELPALHGVDLHVVAPVGLQRPGGAEGDRLADDRHGVEGGGRVAGRGSVGAATVVGGGGGAGRWPLAGCRGGGSAAEGWPWSWSPGRARRRRGSMVIALGRSADRRWRPPGRGDGRGQHGDSEQQRGERVRRRRGDAGGRVRGGRGGAASQRWSGPSRTGCSTRRYDASESTAISTRRATRAVAPVRPQSTPGRVKTMHRPVPQVDGVRARPMRLQRRRAERPLQPGRRVGRRRRSRRAVSERRRAGSPTGRVHGVELAAVGRAARPAGPAPASRRPRATRRAPRPTSVRARCGRQAKASRAPSEDADRRGCRCRSSPPATGSSRGRSRAPSARAMADGRRRPRGEQRPGRRRPQRRAAAAARAGRTAPRSRATTGAAAATGDRTRSKYGLLGDDQRASSRRRAALATTSPRQRRDLLAGRTTPRRSATATQQHEQRRQQAPGPAPPEAAQVDGARLAGARRAAAR